MNEQEKQARIAEIKEKIDVLQYQILALRLELSDLLKGKRAYLGGECDTYRLFGKTYRQLTPDERKEYSRLKQAEYRIRKNRKNCE